MAANRYALHVRIGLEDFDPALEVEALRNLGEIQAAAFELAARPRPRSKIYVGREEPSDILELRSRVERLRGRADWLEKELRRLRPQPLRTPPAPRCDLESRRWFEGRVAFWVFELWIGLRRDPYRTAVASRILSFVDYHNRTRAVEVNISSRLPAAFAMSLIEESFRPVARELARLDRKRQRKGLSV